MCHRSLFPALAVTFSVAFAATLGVLSAQSLTADTRWCEPRNDSTGPPLLCEEGPIWTSPVVWTRAWVFGLTAGVGCGLLYHRRVVGIRSSSGSETSEKNRLSDPR